MEDSPGLVAPQTKRGFSLVLVFYSYDELYFLEIWSRERDEMKCF